MLNDKQKELLAKRIADASEKLAVAGIALGVYQENAFAAFVGGLILAFSLVITWRVAK